MKEILIHITLGGLLMYLLCVLENAYRNKKRADMAENVRTKDERVLSHNATVLVNNKTHELSWYDNDRIIVHKG